MRSVVTIAEVASMLALAPATSAKEGDCQQLAIYALWMVRVVVKQLSLAWIGLSAARPCQRKKRAFQLALERMCSSVWEHLEPMTMHRRGLELASVSQWMVCERTSYSNRLTPEAM